jgi:hypothetical protein
MGFIEAHSEAFETILSENKKVILLTLQFDTDKIYLISSIIEVIRKTQREFNWWIRIHPSLLGKMEEFRSLFLSFGIQEFYIDFPSTLPLYSVLSNVHLHISHSSSTVIEAAQIGVKSVVTSEVGLELFTDIFERGMAFSAINANDIEIIIEYALECSTEISESIFFSEQLTNLTIDDFLNEFNK